MSILSLPTRGRRFYHRHFIDTDLNPSLCQITRIADGLVYYALLPTTQDNQARHAPLKADLMASMDYFLQQSLGCWQDETLPHSERAQTLRRWASDNAIRQVLPLSERAHLVAQYLHAAEGDYVGDRDQAGAPYMNHVHSVAAGVDNEDEKAVAFLHDTQEDHGLSNLDLQWLGFSSEHIAAINNLSKLPDERGAEGYHNFIVRASRHPLSRAVKLADLRDNAILERIPESQRTPHDYRRAEKYRREIAFLESLPPFQATLEIS